MRNSHVVDAIVAIGAFGASMVIAVVVDGAPDDQFARRTILGVVLCGSLVVRRRWPLSVLAFTVTGALVSMALTDTTAASVCCAVIAAYTAASLVHDARGVGAGVVAAAALAGGAVVFSAGPGIGPEDVSVVAWTGMATAAGLAVRSRRAFVNELRERANRAERTRDQEARRRVIEERLTIARDVHDVLAHHIAQINVQSGVASHLLRDNPDAADQALAHIRRAGRSTLEELGMLLDVLRDSSDPPAPMEPAPSLVRLDDLIGSFTGAGPPVELSVSGQPRTLPTATDLAAYRVVQESLTNVHKHAAGTGATVTVAYHPAELVIEVSNELQPDERSPVADDAHPRGGYGIVGMRERVTAAGGVLTAEPTTHGQFLVRAVLPLPDQSGTVDDCL
jgi:signal transduction histidine kinase